MSCLKSLLKTLKKLKGSLDFTKINNYLVVKRLKKPNQNCKK